MKQLLTFATLFVLITTNVVVGISSVPTPNDDSRLSAPETCSGGVITMTGNAAADGTDGNIITYSGGGVSVKASAFSRRISDNLWQTGYLGAFGSGLGVTDRGEGDGSNDTHKVDNIGDRKNYVLFEFDQQVVIDQAYLDAIGADSDITVWIGTATNPFTNHITLSDSVLSGFAPSEDNNAGDNAARWADFNSGNEAGNVLVIAASTSDADPEDAFKIKQLEFDCSAPCSSSEFDLTGNSAGDGTDGNIRTFTSGTTSVKASGFSRTISGGTWQTAFLGSFGPGLGVTDRGEGDGSNDNHKVDNIGDRNNYVLFEFNKNVVVDRAFLDSIGADSDITVWIGTAADPFNNHLTLSDAVLSGFGTSEDNNGPNDSVARWADFNSGAEVGNVIVIGASTSDTSPEDAFKIKLLDVECASAPPARVTIIKQVQSFGGGTASTQAFAFTATNLGTSGFSLVDNNQVGPDRFINNQIQNFGAANAIVVTETQPPGSWSLANLSCVETGGIQNTTVNGINRTATIIVEANESVVCTFVNQQFGPTASTASISGRAIGADSRGISGAILTLQNIDTGEIVSARTNQLGYYVFNDAQVGSFYVLTIAHRRYFFEENTRSFTLNDELSGVDFVQSF